MVGGIGVKNANHPDIIHSNYWDLPHSSGIVFFSCNAGTIRILIPRSKTMTREISGSFDGCTHIDIEKRGNDIRVWFSSNDWFVVLFVVGQLAEFFNDDMLF